MCQNFTNIKMFTLVYNQRSTISNADNLRLRITAFQYLLAVTVILCNYSRFPVQGVSFKETANWDSAVMKVLTE
jgi:hypothetical protein